MKTENKKIDESGVKRTLLIRLSGIDQHVVAVAGVYVSNNKLTELALTRFLKKVPVLKKKKISLKIPVGKSVISNFFNSLKIVKMWKAFDEFEDIKRSSIVTRMETKDLHRRMNNLHTDFVLRDRDLASVEADEPDELDEPSDDPNASNLDREFSASDYRPTSFMGIRDSSIPQRGKYENLVDPMGKT